MVMLRTLLACALIAAPYLMAAEEASNADLDELLWKFDIYIRESKITADILRKININTPASKVQLANIITAYLHQLSYALYSSNVVVPNLVNTDGYSTKVYGIAELNKYIYDIQQLLNKEPDAAKEGFISMLDNLDKILTPFRGHITLPNKFAATEYHYVLSLCIYGVYKIKVQALHFEESNKQLESRIGDIINELSETTKVPSPSNDRVISEYRRFFVLLQLITERVVSRLEHWIEINSKDIKGVQIAKEVIANMRENFSRETHAATEHHSLDDLKSELCSIYISGAKHVQTLAQIEYTENSGGQEFIRTTLFDAIAIPKAFGEHIKSMPYKS